MQEIDSSELNNQSKAAGLNSSLPLYKMPKIVMIMALFPKNKKIQTNFTIFVDKQKKMCYYIIEIKYFIKYIHIKERHNA